MSLRNKPTCLLSIFLFAALCLPFPIGAAPPPPAGTPDVPVLAPVPAIAEPGFRTITEAPLQAWIKYLASEELEGRGTAQPGYTLAARFCASVFETYGLQPAGDAIDGKPGYFQTFNWVRIERDPSECRLQVEDRAGSAVFRMGEDLAASSSIPLRDLEWNGPWVFAGFGEGAESDSPDDFHGFDLKKETAIVFLRPGKTTYDRRGLQAAGGRRALVIFDSRARDPKGQPARELPEFLEKAAPAGGGEETEIIYASARAADRILEPFGWNAAKIQDLAERGKRAPRFRLEGSRLQLAIKNKRSVTPVRNVAAMLEGSDPDLKKEVVAIGAHLDHEGKRDGKIYFGADDDASGSAGVLAAARAFAENGRRPKRSILFLLFAAEEKGLLGSRYFVEHSPVPLQNIVAEIQMDMIGRNEEEKDKEKASDNLNSVHLIGSQKHSRELHRIILDQNRTLGLDFEYDLEEVVYRRSDQYHFAEAGIPVAFFFTGFHPDYHQPTDTPDKINYAKLARIVRLVYLTAFEVAERQGRIAMIVQGRF